MKTKIITSTFLCSLLFKGDYFFSLEKLRIIIKKSRNQFYQSFGNSEEIVKKIIDEYCSTKIEKLNFNEIINKDMQFFYLINMFINDLVNYPHTFSYLIESSKIDKFRSLLTKELSLYLYRKNILSKKTLILYLGKIVEYHLHLIIKTINENKEKSQAKELVNLEINRLIDALKFNIKKSEE